jgi:hypothetical protein
MPRYFFHLRGGLDANDDVGEVFDGREGACEHARRVAWELARGTHPADYQGAWIVVVDGDGGELFTVPLEGSSDPP